MVVLGITEREVVPTCNCFGFSRGCSSNRIFGRSKLRRGASLGESSGGESKHQLMKGSFLSMDNVWGCLFQIENWSSTYVVFYILWDGLQILFWILHEFYLQLVHGTSKHCYQRLVLMVSWKVVYNFQLTMVTLVGLWGICWRKILNPQGTVPWTNRYMMWWYMFNDQKSPYPQWSPHWWV